MINARSHSDLRGFGGGAAPSRAPGGEARGVAAWAEAGAARTSVWEEVANILVDVADFPGPEAQKRRPWPGRTPWPTPRRGMRRGRRSRGKWPGVKPNRTRRTCGPLWIFSSGRGRTLPPRCGANAWTPRI